MSNREQENREGNIEITVGALALIAGGLGIERSQMPDAPVLVVIGMLAVGLGIYNKFSSRSRQQG